MGAWRTPTLVLARRSPAVWGWAIGAVPKRYRFCVGRCSWGDVANRSASIDEVLVNMISWYNAWLKIWEEPAVLGWNGLQQLFGQDGLLLLDMWVLPGREDPRVGGPSNLLSPWFCLFLLKPYFKRPLVVYFSRLLWQIQDTDCEISSTAQVLDPWRANPYDSSPI